MKAIVKATGEIVEVKWRYLTNLNGFNSIRYVDQKTGISYFEEDLFFPKDLADDPDYWTRLEHTYAGMAMQGMLANPAFWKMDWSNNDTLYVDLITMRARSHAHALVEKLKEKEERK